MSLENKISEGRGDCSAVKIPCVKQLILDLGFKCAFAVYFYASTLCFRPSNFIWVMDFCQNWSTFSTKVRLKYESSALGLLLFCV